MEKAGMQVAYFELYCNMPALQLMQMYPQKKECYFPSEIPLQRPPPSPLALPLSPWQSISADKNPASPASFFPLMDFCVASPLGKLAQLLHMHVRVRKREMKKTFLGQRDICGCLTRPSKPSHLRLVLFLLFSQDWKNNETRRKPLNWVAASPSLGCNLYACVLRAAAAENELFGACSGMNMYEKEDETKLPQ